MFRLVRGMEMECVSGRYARHIVHKTKIQTK